MLKGNSISTIEHILSALYAFNVDNVYIDLDSNEVPVCDGSSKEFVALLKRMWFQKARQLQKIHKNKKNS
ncbi:MAG: UDP-3-O-acyl-N-acetylglucosamine deacetylase [Alphaproteobacteria bacterium]